MRKQPTKETVKLERNCIEYSVKFDTGGFVYEQKRSTEFQKATEEEHNKTCWSFSSANQSFWASDAFSDAFGDAFSDAFSDAFGDAFSDAFSDAFGDAFGK